MLAEILKSNASDLSGVSFYTKQLDNDGNMLKNKYGMELLTCNRGTNNTENYHKQIVTMYNTWITRGPMSDCLLYNHHHHFNHDYSKRKCFKFPQVGHYNTWLIDLLQLLMQRNHRVLLYPDWSNASNFIETQEKFGTVPLHSPELAAALHENVNLDLSIKFIPE